MNINLFTKHVFFFLSAFGLMFLFSATSSAQEPNRTIRGTVTSKENIKETLVGVTITRRGTSPQTAVTDINGNFSISAKTGDVLSFTYIGFAPTQVTVGSANQLSVSMATATSNLNEVVVVGYGTSTRQEITGAISSIKASQIAQTLSPTLDQALQGKVAGVVVNSNSGQPGGGVSVQIRGVSTLGNAQPLYVIDGVFFDGGDTNSQVYTGGAPTTNPLATINPSDIESMDVLKDASATAIYGSRGSNGVVIITTKKGKVGAPKINFDTYFGVQQLPKQIPVLDLQQYAVFRNERDRIFFNTPRIEFQDPSVLGKGTNWQDVIFKNAPMQNYNLSISGGDARTTYLLSGGYFNQEGIAVKSGFKRLNTRLSLENKTTDWLKIGTNLQVTRTNEQINNQDGNLIQLAIRQSPDIAAVNPDGSFGGPPSSEFVLSNPYGLTLLSTNERQRSQVYGNLFADITFLKDFVLRNEYAGNYEFGNIVQFTPTYQFGLLVNNTSQGTRASNTFAGNTLRTYLSYNHTFLDLLKVNGTLGHESVVNKSSSLTGTGSGFPSNSVSELNLSDPALSRSTSTKYQYALDSYYGRFNFTYNDKYLLTSTFRYDGTSNFSPENRWNFSYAFALAYRLSQESFLKGNETINDLKLRLGYGLLNNQNVGNYVYGTSFRGVQTGLGLGLLINNLQNPDAKWETTKASNIGVDASLLKSRINLAFDAYIKNTDDLLSSLPLPLYSGTTPSDQYTVAQLTAPTKNIGSITNRGFEFSINTENIKGKNFSWNSTITYSQNKNKVTSLVTGGTIIPQYIGTDIISQVAVGRSIGEFYGYQVEGVYRDANDLNTHPRPINNSTGQGLPIGVDQIWLGDLKFKDINGDGKIDQNDRVYLGSPIPKFQFGVNNTFKYKSFELTFFFNGNYGNKIFNNIKRENEDPRSNFGLLQSVNDFARIGLINATGNPNDVNNLYITNPGTTVPRVSAGDANQNTRPSSRYIEDGSYIRLKNAIVGYNLPYNFVHKAKLSYVRVYTNVQNVFTVTNYTGYDPEVGSRFQGATSAGIDYGRYPSQRIFTIGLNAGF